MTLTKKEDFILTKKAVNGSKTEIPSSAYHSLFKNITTYFGNKEEDARRACYKKHQQTKNCDSVVGKEFPNWHFIPLETSTAAVMLEFVKAYTIKIGTYRKGKGLRFLDAGCGPGNIILLARQVGVSYQNECHGIELDKEAATLGNILIGAVRDKPSKVSTVWKRGYPTHIFNSDIITFKHYKRYGIIYYFCPIKLPPLQQLFEERLEDIIKVGAIIMPNLKRSQLTHQDERFKTVTCYNDKGGSFGYFLVKVKDGPRLTTAITLNSLKCLPDKYLKMATKHVTKVKNNNTKNILKK